jgi:hypothetical protein
MEKEVDGLQDNDTFEVEERSSVPHHIKLIQAIWSFQRKRLPGDWSIQKWKSSLCPHGGRQVEGVTYWDAYAPVVIWSTVQLIMILSLLSDLHTKKVDYVQAYTHKQT